MNVDCLDLSGPRGIRDRDSLDRSVRIPLSTTQGELRVYVIRHPGFTRLKGIVTPKR